MNNNEIEILEFTLPDWCACPLINHDGSGLSEEEDRSLVRFMQSLTEEYATACCVSVKEDSGFTHSNDLNNLGDNCSTFIFHVTAMQPHDPYECI